MIHQPASVRVYLSLSHRKLFVSVWHAPTYLTVTMRLSLCNIE